jgi:hypothetical protein
MSLRRYDSKHTDTQYNGRDLYCRVVYAEYCIYGLNDECHEDIFGQFNPEKGFRI